MAKKRKRKVVKRRAPARRRVHRNPLPPTRFDPLSSNASDPRQVYTDADVVFEFGSTYPDGTLRPEGYRNWYIVQVKTDAQMDYEYQQFSQGLCFARGIYKYRQQMHDGTSLMYCMHSPEGRSKLFWDVHIPALDCSSINIDNIAGNTHSADCPARRGTFHVSQIKGAGQRHPNMQEAFMCSQFMVEYLQIDPALCQNLQSGLAEIEQARQAEYQRLELERARAEGRLPNRQMPPRWQDTLQRELLNAASRDFWEGAVDFDSFRQVMSETVVKYTFPAQTWRPQLVVVVRWDQGTEFEDKNGAFVLTFSKSGQRGSKKLTLVLSDDVSKAITMFYTAGDVPAADRGDGSDPEYRRLFFPPPSENWKEDLVAMVSDMLTPETRSLLGTPRRSLHASKVFFEISLVRREANVSWLPLLNRFKIQREADYTPYHEMRTRTLEETAREVVAFLEVDTPFIFDSPMLPILRRIVDAMGSDYGLRSRMEPRKVTPQLILGSGNYELILLWQDDQYRIEYEGNRHDITQVPTTEEAIQIVVRYLTTGRRWYPWVAAMDKAEAIIKQNVNFPYAFNAWSTRREDPDARVILQAEGHSLLWVKVNDPDVAILTYKLTTPQRREVPYAQLEEQLVQDVQDINSILQTAATTPSVALSVWSMLRHEGQAATAIKKYVDTTYPNLNLPVSVFAGGSVKVAHIANIQPAYVGVGQELQWTVRPSGGSDSQAMHAEEALAFLDEAIAAATRQTAPTAAAAPAPAQQPWAKIDLSKRNWRSTVKKKLLAMYGPNTRVSYGGENNEDLFVFTPGGNYMRLTVEPSRFLVFGDLVEGGFAVSEFRDKGEAKYDFFERVMAMMKDAGVPRIDQAQSSALAAQQREMVSPWQYQFLHTWLELVGFSSWLSHYDVVPRSADSISIKINNQNERMLLRELDAYSTLIDRASIVGVRQPSTNRYVITTVSGRESTEPTPEDAARWVFNHLSGVRSSAQIRQNDRALSQRLQAQAQAPSEVLRSTGARPELVEAMREAELPPQEPWIADFMTDWRHLVAANPWLLAYSIDERPAISAANPHPFLRIYTRNEGEIERLIQDPNLANQPAGADFELTVATVERTTQYGGSFEVTLGTSTPTIVATPYTAASTVVSFLRFAARHGRQNPRTPRRNPASIHAWLGIAEKPKKSKKLRRKSGKRKR